MSKRMLCPKCKTDHAHRSHRRGPLELAASLVAVFPYRCRDCGHRFLKFRYAESGGANPSGTEREIRATRDAMAWKRKRRDWFLYGGAMLLFLAFLYYITRQHGGSPDGG